MSVVPWLVIIFTVGKFDGVELGCKLEETDGANVSVVPRLVIMYTVGILDGVELGCVLECITVDPSVGTEPVPL